MAEKIADGIEAVEEKPAKPVQRLCNEIQLFDLCELEKCGHKQGLYCINTELLERFEAIAEEEVRPAAGYDSDDLEDAEANDDDGYDDAFDDEYDGEYDDEGYEEDE